MSGNYNLLVERLVAAVARAFYTDDFVVVLDTLIREKYIREEELGPRLKLREREVMSVINQLCDSEMMISYEDVLDECGRTSKFYYIDYQLFVNVVRYRVALMEKSLKNNEKHERTEAYYQCPRCKVEYNIADVCRLLSSDDQFICPACCPIQNFRGAVADPAWTLKEVDNRSRLNKAVSLEKKMRTQLGRCDEGLHDSIFDLLADLRDCPLMHNKPSDNRSRGVGSSEVNDADVQQIIDERLGNKRVNKISREKASQNQKQFIFGKEVDEFSITIATDEEELNEKTTERLIFNDNLNGNDEEERKAKRARDASLPDFLRNSRVKSAADLLRENNSTDDISVKVNSNIKLESNIDNNNVIKEEVKIEVEKEVIEEEIDWEEDDEDDEEDEDNNNNDNYNEENKINEVVEEEIDWE
jgi:transcription initiation factor IIE alpha subunit